jgi:hypothetical protein
MGKLEENKIKSNSKNESQIEKLTGSLNYFRCFPDRLNE